MSAGVAVEGALAARWNDVLGDATAWSPPAVATVVVVPHPDDESLMFGGLIARQRSRGVAVSIVSVTDGERSYPSLEPSSVAAIRRAEQVSALERLGAGAGEVVRLQLPDGDVARDEDRLADRLTDLVAGSQLVVAPWRGDHHCDHEATGRAAATAAHRAGIGLAAGLFWTWHHVEPRTCSTGSASACAPPRRRGAAPPPGRGAGPRQPGRHRAARPAAALRCRPRAGAVARGALRPVTGADVGSALHRLVASGGLDLPAPGSGGTARRHRALFDLARRETVSVARCAEAHVDALAILAEAGRPPVEDAR